ncbi:MAG: hypothetical protein KBG28_09525 [Kofleriaceae bacterium]|nr:hypothetical protein [Kofleriaceae bacterium]
MIRILSASDRLPFDGSFEDWLQASWEVLVEGELLHGGKGWLANYGEGAFSNEPSNRVFRLDALPTHGVFVEPKDASAPPIDSLDRQRILSSEGELFSEFGVMEHGGVRLEFPISTLLTERLVPGFAIPACYPISAVRFVLREYSPD